MEPTYAQVMPRRRQTTHGFVPSLMDNNDSLWQAAWDQPPQTWDQPVVGSAPGNGYMRYGDSLPRQPVYTDEHAMQNRYQATPVPFQPTYSSTTVRPGHGHQRTISTPAINNTELSYPRELTPGKWKPAKERKKKKEKSFSSISSTVLRKKSKSKSSGRDVQTNTPGSPDSGHHLNTTYAGHPLSQSQWASSSTLASDNSAYNGSQTLPLSAVHTASSPPRLMPATSAGGVSATPAPFPLELENALAQPMWGSHHHLGTLQRQQETMNQQRQQEALNQQRQQEALNQQRQQEAYQQRREAMERKKLELEQRRQQELFEQQRRQAEEKKKQEQLEQRLRQEAMERQIEEQQRKDQERKEALQRQQEALYKQQRQQEALRQQQEALQSQRRQLREQQKQKLLQQQQQRRRQLDRNEDPRSFFMQRQQSLKEDEVRKRNQLNSVGDNSRRVPRSQSALDSLNQSLEALSMPITTNLSPRSRARFDSSQTEGSDEYDNTTVDESTSEISGLEPLPNVKRRDNKVEGRKNIISLYDNDDTTSLPTTALRNNNQTDDDLMRRMNGDHRKISEASSDVGVYRRDDRKYEPPSHELRRERVERWNHKAPNSEARPNQEPMWSAQNGIDPPQTRGAQTRDTQMLNAHTRSAPSQEPQTKGSTGTYKFEVPSYSSIRRRGEESDTSGFVDSDELSTARSRARSADARLRSAANKPQLEALRRSAEQLEADLSSLQLDDDAEYDSGTLKKSDEKKKSALTSRQLAEKALKDDASDSDASTPNVDDTHSREQAKLDTNEFAVSEVSSGTDEFRAQLDVRHFRPEELEVKTIDKAVVIRGTHPERSDDHGSIERTFKRTYKLPKECDPMQVRSMVSPDGILTILAPKRKVRRVTIVDPSQS